MADRRLGEIVKDGIKGVIAKRTIQQVVAAERTEFIGEVRKVAEGNVGELGITLVDVRVKSIDLPEEVSESVFNRMQQDFARQAAQLRAEGSAVSERTAPRPIASAPRPWPRLPRRRDHPRRGRCRRPRTSTRARYSATRSSIAFHRACRPTAARSASRATSSCFRRTASSSST